MAQNFPTILPTNQIKDSLAPLLDRDDAAASNFSGTAFPSAGLLVGMECHRTDQNAIYRLIDLSPSWLKIADVDPTNGRIVATHAAQLSTARTIGVTGDVSDASASFDGSADASISVTVKSASTTVAGKVKLATNAETATGTDATRAVTPAAMKSVTDTLAPKADPTFTGTVTAPVARLTATADATLASTGHALQVGASNGANLVADTNEVQARNNGAAATLVLNGAGGGISLGDATSAIAADGTILGNIRATQAEAEAGTATNKIMTPLRVAQAIAALASNPTSAEIGALYAGVSAGGIGSLRVMVRTPTNNPFAAGSTYSGSQVLMADMQTDAAFSSAAQSGTWRALNSSAAPGCALCIRIA